MNAIKRVDAADNHVLKKSIKINIHYTVMLNVNNQRSEGKIKGRRKIVYLRGLAGYVTNQITGGRSFTLQALKSRGEDS